MAVLLNQDVSPRRFFQLHRPSELVIWRSALILLVLGLHFMIAFSIRPRAPKFFIHEVSVSRFNLTTDSGAAHLSSDMLFTVSAENPNKGNTFVYDGMQATVSYSGFEIGRGAITPFHQDVDTIIELPLQVQGEDAGLLKDMGTSLLEAMASKSNLWLRTKMITNVSVVGGLVSWKNNDVKVFCDLNLNAHRSSGDTHVESKRCKVDWSNWSFAVVYISIVLVSLFLLELMKYLIQIFTQNFCQSQNKY